MSDEPWPGARLGDIADLAFGATPSRNVDHFWDTDGSGYPWASISDLRISPVSKTAEHITRAGIKGSSVRLVKSGTPLMSFKLTIGRVAKAGVDLYTNEAIVAVHGKAGFADDGWLFHALPQIASAGIQDSAVKGNTLNKDKLENLLLSLPPLAEQRTVARILDAADDAIGSTEQLIAKLERVRDGLLYDLLMGGSDNFGDGSHDAVPLQQASPTQAIAWKVGPAEEFCERIMVGVVTSSTGSYANSGVPFVRSQNVRPNNIIRDDMLYITDQFNRSQSKSILRAGDVVIVRTGYPGTAAVIPAELDGANCFSLIVCRPRPILDSFFLSCYMNSPIGRTLVMRTHFGSAQHNLNIAEMKRLLIPVPPLGEQRKILSVMSTIDNRLAGEVRTLQKMRLIKQGLTADLLTGRMRLGASA